MLMFEPSILSEQLILSILFILSEKYSGEEEDEDGM
jgi:hypothetical protein